MRIYKCDRCLKEMTTSEINSTRPISAPSGSLHEFCKKCEYDYDEGYIVWHKEFMSRGRQRE